MGMDLIGKNPRNKKGEYFRNNVWYWSSLWKYCDRVAPNIWGQVKGGLGDKKSRAMAKVLRKEIESGRTEEYEAKYMGDKTCDFCEGTGHSCPWLISTPHPCSQCRGSGKCNTKAYPFETSNVEKFATFLENCGGFKIS